MNGFAPLSPTTIRHYRKEMGISRLAPREVEALIAIDAVMLNPEVPKQGGE